MEHIIQYQSDGSISGDSDGNINRKRRRCMQTNHANAYHKIIDHPCDNDIEKMIKSFFSDTLYPPGPNDLEKRQEIIQKLTDICHAEFGPDAQISVFGSLETGLWLSSGDIDISVNSEKVIPRFYPRLESALKGFGYTVQVLSQARVPIAKVVMNGINVDIVHEKTSSENREHSSKVTDWVLSWLNIDPFILGPVVMVVKEWARKREVCSIDGGVPSLGLLLMIFSCVGQIPTISKHLSAIRVPYKELKQCTGSGLNRSELLSRFFKTFKSGVFEGSETRLIYTKDMIPNIMITYGLDEFDPLHVIREMKKKARDARGTGAGTVMFMPDPIDPSINLGRFVTWESQARIEREFKRASECSCLERLLCD